jgi:hypothetical protein
VCRAISIHRQVNPTILTPVKRYTRYLFRIHLLRGCSRLHNFTSNVVCTWFSGIHPRAHKDIQDAHSRHTTQHTAHTQHSTHTTQHTAHSTHCTKHKSREQYTNTTATAQTPYQHTTNPIIHRTQPAAKIKGRHAPRADTTRTHSRADTQADTRTARTVGQTTRTAGQTARSTAGANNTHSWADTTHSRADTEHALRGKQHAQQDAQQGGQTSSEVRWHLPFVFYIYLRVLFLFL